MIKKFTVTMTDKKFRALKYSLELKNTTVEKELESALEKIYEDNVAEELRGFVEAESRSDSQQ